MCHIQFISLSFITVIFQRTIARTIKLFKDRILATHHQYCQQWMVWSSQVTYITRNWDDFTEPSNYRMCKSSSGEQHESTWIQTKHYRKHNSLISVVRHVSTLRTIIGHYFRNILKTYIRSQLSHLLRHKKNVKCFKFVHQKDKPRTYYTHSRHSAMSAIFNL